MESEKIGKEGSVMGQYYLAIDIGASSGRHILGHVENGRMVLEEMYRFDNRQQRRDGHDCWDVENLWQGILGGLKACKAQGKIPATVGIDTWAVDFVLLDKDGKRLGDAVAYRDGRTEGMDKAVDALIPPAELYARTGIQKQLFNTIYQLMALKQEHPEQLEAAHSLLMIPDYFNYLLTGVQKQEYTNASSTNLVNAAKKTWDRELLDTLGLPRRLFGPLSMPGTVVGPLKEEIAAEVGFQTTVILPATHDTGSAFLAVPARDDRAVYLSSGTWSLLGVENEAPITTEESRAQNFTNEGGAWYRFRYLKNIMGLWMIQSIRRELNGVDYVAGKTRAAWTLDVKAGEKQWSFPDLIAAAESAADFTAVVDANDDAFLAPDSMILAVQKACAAAGQPVPQTVGQLMQCVYRSLTLCYKNAIAGLSELTGKTYTSINIVGGGCQDNYLNRMTAAVTGLPVYAGPVEGTAIGNLAVQMIHGGEFAGLVTARQSIRESFDIKEVLPQ
ncbi:rhamnulokinase [Gemmiger formicilis]|uniref:rhamnulokinase n=1 Tax=Gemmiger formicilis TaxID=745368 RepID=UPI0031F623E7